MSKIKVLYIDDEQNNLNGFKAAFRFDYNILLANNTDIASDYLKKHPDIQIILCDQRMPDKTGVQFFEEIRQDYPNPIRMLITGYTDIESVIDGINKGHIFRYIRKPWEESDIKSAIEEGHKFYIASSLITSKNEELQSAYNELGKFAYSVTHDMRGPLLSILGALEVANMCDTVDEMKEMMGMMESAVRKLDEFITNTHEYYNIKRGQLLYEQIDFKQVIDDVEVLFKIAEKSDNIRFTSKVNQSVTFMSDVVSLKIVLNNLFSNAFKYQRKDNTDKYVEVEVDVNPTNAVIFVRDNGIGIHEKHIGSIFDMFYRATTQEAGSGFGLYNVKDALNKLNGKIEVESTPDVGTTFKVTIPGKAHGAK